jgi:S1-C subfamily serine protease
MPEMATVFPVMAAGRPVGSAIALEKRNRKVAFATALHLLGATSDIKVIIPPHGGNCLLPQRYPVEQVRYADATIGAVDPFSDLAILLLRSDDDNAIPALRIADRPFAIGVGQEVVVLGYPFAPIGSILETFNPDPARARRMGEG